MKDVSGCEGGFEGILSKQGRDIRCCFTAGYFYQNQPLVLAKAMAASAKTKSR